MILSKYTLKNIQSDKVQKPDEAIFELPEKVLQFGTGVLLRGLPDYFIDKANRKGVFNGRIVIVKSTSGGDAAAFEKQDSLYTLCVRGLENGKAVEENIINSSISRVLSAADEWDKVLECAHNPNLQIVTSNTTEIGIELVNDDIRKHPPVSFPGKLLAFLYERYKAFDGSKQSGMIIVPTELISDNGKKLEAIVTEQAHLNGLDAAFIEWLESSNTFCNTLVDRIVPGKPSADTKAAVEKELGYSDDLLIMSEVYRLWAIEGDEHVKSVLSFAQVDDGVAIVPNITKHKELKLRLLNGTHTLSCALAHLAGFATVKAAMADSTVSNFVSKLMKKDIAPAIPYKVDAAEAEKFANSVLDRFANPNIEHQWLSIAGNYTQKIEMRVVALFSQYISLFNKVPEYMSLGFAAYIQFMKAVKKDGNKYFGIANGQEYPITDDKASYYFSKKDLSDNELVAEVLGNTAFWGQDLNALPGFTEAVQEQLSEIVEKGALQAIQNIEKSKILA
ncbi:tagaturonate reductase [Ferruginibacter sp. SUN002]|uniref:tagaturonate reductase n=1 Tax=Ferruginibacter sp. SUN002 TaxID=2937789 RepID=UPI003D360E71